MTSSVTDDTAMEIQAVASDFVETRWTRTQLRAWVELGGPAPAELWRGAAEMGWFRLLARKSRGGLELGAVAAAEVMRVVGAGLVPGPVLDSIVAGAIAFDAGADLPEDARVCHLDTVLTSSAAGTVSGTAKGVSCAADADFFVGQVIDSSGPRLVVTAADGAGVEVAPVDSIDPLRRAEDVTLDDAAVVWLGGSETAAAVTRISLVSTALRAAECAGLLQQVLRMSATYALEREQFGRPIGSFQAIKGRLAEMAVFANVTDNVSRNAAMSIDSTDEDTEPDRWVSVAKAYASQAVRSGVEEALQVHGGIGFTTDHDLHFYFKRALSLQTSWGDQRHHGAALLERQVRVHAN